MNKKLQNLTAKDILYAKQQHKVSKFVIAKMLRETKRSLN